MSAPLIATAAYRPIGGGLRPWVALVNGEPLSDRRGAARRYGSEDAAQDAADLDAFLRLVS